MIWFVLGLGAGVIAVPLVCWLLLRADPFRARELRR